MRKNILLTVFATLICCFQVVAQEHFISDANFYEKVKTDFEWKKKQLPEGNFFNFSNKLSPYEREALTFMYAYMPESDITAKPVDYFLENIRLTRQACNEMPWGKDLNEQLIRYFVLPLRVNNEPLDDARKVFFNELKDRIKGLSLHDAVIEVNHWCHEKVVYTPSDGRTSSPLQSLRTAFGRCGEESTFCVAALRSVGIPARQVYTPRWAHTDDNHAWVEAWVDGKWHFLGACEPEPVLDLGWFNAPASRGMLMHTKVFGNYNGAEEVMLKTPTFTEINVIDNYATSARTDIKAEDANGNPINNAKVEFKVYNYGEFYTVATKYTDAQGQTFLTSGLGDMIVWVSKDGKYGYDKVSFGKEKLKTIKVDRNPGEAYTVDFDIVPPPEHYNLPDVTPEQRAHNDMLATREDSIRNAYVATMMNHAQGVEFAQKEKLDTALVSKFLVKSRGNHSTITNFLSKAKDKNLATELLKTVSAKDLRDIPAEVLEDNLAHSVRLPQVSDEEYYNFVLCPRVELEALTPYKAYFQKVLSKSAIKAYRNDPSVLAKWCKENIKIDDALNQTSTPIIPKGVWLAKRSDNRSRNVFFVSVCRSIGVPARVDEVTGKVQYRKGGEWVDVDLVTGKPQNTAQGILKATYEPTKEVQNPKYYTHFTLSKFDNGTFKLQNYDEGDIDMGGGSDYENMLKPGLKMDAGYYMLVSGSRQPDGSVLSEITFLNIKDGETTNTVLNLRKKATGVEVIGNLNSELAYQPLDSKASKTIKETVANDGWYVLAVLGVNQEPTNHALRDIAAMKADFEAWNQPIILLFPSKADKAKFRSQDFPGLPTNIVWGLDNNKHIQQSIVEGVKLSNSKQLPMVVLANVDGRVVFVSQGYTIGLGNQIMKVIHGL